MGSARAMLRFNSESILGGISELMMSRNNEGVLQLIQEMSGDSEVYRNIRLVSHESGEIVVSRLDAAGARMALEDRACAICHDQGADIVASVSQLDEVARAEDGTRLLRVITPINNETRCRAAPCHAHSDSGPILGFLQTEYSLAQVDALTSGLNTSFAVAALVAIALGTLALWIMFAETLGKAIRHTIAGIRAIAGDNLSFRFATRRTDEFGLVERAFNDMADRIQAHQTELREAMEYLEGIVENSADIIITVNPNGLIQTINRGAETALGYDRGELVGQRIEVLFADPRERDVAIGRLRDTDNVTNFETRFLTKNAEIRHVLLTLSRLRDRDGNAIGTFGISKDITREKNLQERLFQAEKDAALGQAVTSIQHAIKNMLNTLAGGSYLARQGMTRRNDVRIVDGLNMIEDGIHRIRDLSTNMLRFAREWTLELTNVDIAKMIRDVAKGIEPRAGEMGVAVRYESAEEMPLVSCDAQLIHMALMDMATNAMEACWQKQYEAGEAAAITISARVEADDDLVIAVADNGIGMSAETREKIFTPFFSTKEEWGTGLGLASTLRIISMHGGTIDVESESNKGTTFRITLPVWNTSAKKGA
jgi:PAS domain S-box-containing protein